MDHPWMDISLSDYESHMSLEEVAQLQALDRIMNEQFDAFPAATVMILGVAGGNGLEHIDTEKYGSIYGVDINPGYLEETRRRFRSLGDALKLLCVDLRTEAETLPAAELLIADLLIEYIGYGPFHTVVKITSPRFVSCVIQIDEAEGFVSDSPYLHAFDRLEEIHCRMDRERLTETMIDIGYERVFSAEYPLPNHKQLARLDFSRKEL